MLKNKPMARLMRVLITLLGAGLGAAIAALLTPIVSRVWPEVFGNIQWIAALYAGLCLLLGLLFFLLSPSMIDRTMRLIAGMESRWSRLSSRQLFWIGTGLVMGLAVAALVAQLILSLGTNLLTISLSALTYLVLGFVGFRIGLSRSRKPSRRSRNRQPEPTPFEEMAELLMEDEETEAASAAQGAARKYLDTSVIIDGRIADVAQTGFLEGDIVVPAFVLAELRHIADSADNLRRARGRRGLDVLSRLQKLPGLSITVDETDYPDAAEVDVKLLRLCRDKGGVVVTNDYNLNKVAAVTGIRVLNINDLANAVKPMLVTGEELNVQVVREGKEPGQGVSFLDDGTMIVIENGRRYVGDRVPVVVTSVLQTSAGRMIFAKLKSAEEKGA